MKTAFALFVLALVTSVSFTQWVEQTIPANTGLYSISAVDNSCVWICGADGYVIRTVNGGTNWNQTVSPNSSLDIYSICAVEGQTAVVTGSTSSYTYVYKTSNAGSVWFQVFSQAGGFINSIRSLSLTDPNRLIFCGNPVGGRWQIWTSSDAGSHWDSAGSLGGNGYIPQSGNETGFDNSFFVYRGNDLERKMWFGTNNTRAYRNGFIFTIWDYVLTPGQQNGFALMFADQSVGFLGSNTGLLFTTNGGSSWMSWNNILGTGSIKGFTIGYNTGEMQYVRGSSIYKTTDAGASWENVHTIQGTYYYMEKARNGYNTWAIWNSTGDNSGNISQYIAPIGIKSISNEVPASYSLFQNYPNPFNPATKIKFDVPAAWVRYTEHLQLVIYDILGSEIAVLVNEQLKPGTYEVQWDASNFPSGVYYYKITAGDYSETKKMVLIK